MFEEGGFLGVDSIGLFLLMSLVRGFFRKRKKTDKKHEENASASGSLRLEEGPLDWWDEFSWRVNGISSSRL